MPPGVPFLSCSCLLLPVPCHRHHLILSSSHLVVISSCCHPGGAMVGLFTALPVPCPLSLSSCGGPVVPLAVAPLSAP